MGFKTSWKIKAWAGCLWAVLACAFSVQLHAHDPGLSTARVVVGDTAIELRVGFAPADVTAMLPASARVAEWTTANVAAREAALRELGALLYAVRADGRALVVTEENVVLVTGDRMEFFFKYARPVSDTGAGAAVELKSGAKVQASTEIEKLEFDAVNLGALPATHREYFSATTASGIDLGGQMLKVGESVAVLSLRGVKAGILTEGASSDSKGVSVTHGSTSGAGAAASSGEPIGKWNSFGGFLVLGIEHIWTGYDHLLFLFGMLLVCRTLRSVALIITAFTIAHSITLAVATLRWVSLPAEWVEPTIAASILFVGIENLIRKGKEPRGRGWLTFVFGLIHGFGFASVLSDLGVGQNGSGIAVPLFAFNLGVETGQLVVAAVVLPLLMRLRKHPQAERIFLPVCSAFVAAAGAWWLVERLWLG